jgi:hypothetical protein
VTVSEVERAAGDARQCVRNAVDALQGNSVEALDLSTKQMAAAAEHLQGLIHKIDDLKISSDASAGCADKPLGEVAGLGEVIGQVRRDLGLIALLLHQLIEVRTGWMPDNGYTPDGMTVEPPSNRWAIDG